MIMRLYIRYNNGREANKVLFHVIKNLMQTGQMKVDQLINENNYMWIHVSYKIFGKNRNQILAL